MATQPSPALLDASPEAQAAAASSRAAQGQAAIRAALKTRKATLDQIQKIAQQYDLTLPSPETAQAAIDWSKQKGNDPGLIDIQLVDPLAQATSGLLEGAPVSIAPPLSETQQELQRLGVQAPLLSAADAVTEAYRNEPVGLDPATQEALRQYGLGSMIPILQIPAIGTEAVQAGLSGASRFLTQTAANIVNPITGQRTIAPRREAEQLMGVADFASMMFPFGVGPELPPAMRTVEQLPPQQATLRRMATPRAASVAAEIPTPPRIEAPAAARVEIPAPPVAAPKVDIPVTPQNLAAAETALGRATAELPKVEAPVDFAGNINLSKIETSDDAKNLIDIVAQSNDQFLEARRGTMSIPQLNDLADQVSLESILGRKIGEAMPAERVIAARRAVSATSEEAIAAAKKYRENPADENLRTQAIESLLRQAAFQEQLSGASAEAGRVLRALRETQGAEKSRAVKAIVGDLTGVASDSKKMDEILDLVSRVDTPEEAARFIGDMTKPGFKDKLTEFWINSLLAGPQTHAVNFVSNLGTSIVRLPENLLAAGVGKLTRSADRVTFREVGKRAVGMVQGTLDGLEAAKKAARGEDIDLGGSKIETPRREAIGGTAGKIVRVPSRALEVQDALFKGINRRGEIAAQAYAKAEREARGDTAKVQQLYQQYLASPTQDILDKADEFARYQVFQNELIGLPQKVQQLANQSAAVRFLVPFIRTPVNILKYARDRSLLAPLTRVFWDDIKAGGRRRDEALARLTLGAGITGTVGALVEQGAITGGGPTDPGQRSALLATGWQPYSFKVGDQYYSYARLEPISTVLGVSADFFTMSQFLKKDQLEDAAALIPMSIAKNIFDKTFLMGIADFMQAVTDPERYGESYVKNFALSFMPNVLGQTARALDPTLRRTETFGEAAQARVPGLSEQLTERLDPWGDPIVRVGYKEPEEGGLAVVYNLLTPVRVSQSDTSSPAKTEAARLNLDISQPRDTITRKGLEVELTPEEYNDFIAKSGSVAKEVLDEIVQEPWYGELTEEEKTEVFQKVFSKTRSEFRDETLIKALDRLYPE